MRSSLKTHPDRTPYLTCFHELLPEFRCLSCSSNLHVWLSTYALLFHDCFEYDLCCGRVLIGLALQCVRALVCVCVRALMFLFTNVCLCICQHADSVSSVGASLRGPAHVALLQSEWLFPLLLTCALCLPFPVQPCLALWGPVCPPCTGPHQA